MDMDDMMYDTEEGIITLTTPDGEEIEFIPIADVELTSGHYLILQPLELLEDMAEDEALVFRLEETMGTVTYRIVEDEKVIDEVFREYDLAYDEQMDIPKS